MKGKKISKKITTSFKKALLSFGKTLPILIGVILLIGLFQAFITKDMISSFFKGDILFDTIIGSSLGSISAGNPIISYLIGGKLLKEGVSLFAVTSFIVAWVTVGVIQFPAESEILGRRFALTRNIISFVLSIIVSILTVLTLMVFE